MKIDVLTLFPDMLNTVFGTSIIGRAKESGIVTINCTDIRDFSLDKHRKVDDTPYGGGMGMVMAPDPIFRAYESVAKCYKEKPHTVYLTPKGKTFTQNKAIELSKKENIVFLCGHYEGVDERVLDEIVDEEISIGDYVLTGGELAAAVVIDAVCRMIPGVLSSEECYTNESHFSGLLEYPQYTRPFTWHGVSVPEVLISGHHENITNWRREQSIITTCNKRPEMLDNAELSKEDLKIIEKLK